MGVTLPTAPPAGGEATAVPEQLPADTAAPTDTPVPTNTPLPTDTSTPTHTPTPSDTPTATNTPTPSDTPTVTNTPGPSPTPTPSLTPTLTPVPTATPDVREEYGKIVYGELIDYADNHKGEKVRISGSVFNIGNGFFQIWLNGGTDSVIVSHAACTTLVCVPYLLEDHPLPDQIYDGTWITTHGEVGGFLVGTNAYGATITVPEVYAHVIER